MKMALKDGRWTRRSELSMRMELPQKAGDEIETSAIKTVFGEYAYKIPSVQQNP